METDSGSGGYDNGPRQDDTEHLGGSYGYIQPGDKEFTLERADGVGGNIAQHTDNSTFYTSPRQKRKKNFAYTSNTIGSQPTSANQISHSNVTDTSRKPVEAYCDGLSPGEQEPVVSRGQDSGKDPSPEKEVIQPLPLDPHDLDTDLEYGSMVEVVGNPPECRYGVIRWVGYLRDKNKPIAGIELVSIQIIRQLILTTDWYFFHIHNFYKYISKEIKREVTSRVNVTKTDTGRRIC